MIDCLRASRRSPLMAYDPALSGLTVPILGVVSGTPSPPTQRWLRYRNARLRDRRSRLGRRASCGGVEKAGNAPRQSVECMRNRSTSPPVAAVLMVNTRSVANRCRYSGPPALGPVPDSPLPPKGCTPTTAPIMLRLM